VRMFWWATTPTKTTLCPTSKFWRSAQALRAALSTRSLSRQKSTWGTCRWTRLVYVFRRLDRDSLCLF